MAEAEVAGRHFERLACENVAGPGACGPWQFDWFDSGTIADRFFGASDERVCGSARGIVTASDVDFDVAETAFCQVSLQRLGGFFCFHVRNKTKIHFCDGTPRENCLPALAGVARDEPFDIYRWTRREKLEGFFKIHIINPVLDAERFLCGFFVQSLGGACDHFLFRIADWTGFVRKVIDGGILTVGRHERSERFDEMPRRTIEARFVAGMNVFDRATTPFCAAADEFEFDDAFRAVGGDDGAVEVL